MEKFYLGALQGCSQIGGAHIRRLVDYFGSGEAVWRAQEAAVTASGILPEMAREGLFAARREQPDLPASLQEECSRKGIKVCSMADSEYPELLKEIHNPPMVLFYRGSLRQRPRIAMVGARKVSAYGRAVAEQLASALAVVGFSVVSGAALGVDSCSHRGALKRGVTEAVLGCGTDVVYPRSNKSLLEEIAQEGAVISEYLPGAGPLAGNFPARNRIISGMCLGTVVVEAAERSGSLITAEQALSEGRDVFAVPGSIFSPVSRGCNRLLQQGAKAVLDSHDIIDEYTGLLKYSLVEEKKKNLNDNSTTRVIITEVEAAILRVLTPDEPLSVDEIICRSHIRKAADVTFALLQLELKEMARSDNLQRYVRTVKEGVL